MEGTPEGQEKGGAAAGNGKGEIVKAKVVEWEEFQDVLAQMCGRGLVLKKSLVDREALSQQLEAALEVISFLALCMSLMGLCAKILARMYSCVYH